MRIFKNKFQIRNQRVELDKRVNNAQNSLFQRKRPFRSDWMLLDSIGLLMDGWIGTTQRNQHSLPLTTQYQSV